jgi:HEPN domain-containing protein
MHLRAARVLIATGHWSSAYHLAGFAVECGLKASIAKRTRRYDFPPRDTTRELYIHDLTALVKAADLGAARDAASRASKAFDKNWATVKDWTVESRYDPAISEQMARDLYRAITARHNGVMGWIRKLW